MAGYGRRRRLGLWGQPRLRPRAGGVLAHGVRLARPGSTAELAAQLSGRGGRTGHPLHSRPGQRPSSPADRADPRVAEHVPRRAGGAPSTLRPCGARRRRCRRFRRRHPIAAGLRLLRSTVRKGHERKAYGRAVVGTHAGTWLPPVRGPRGRLGGCRHHAARLGALRSCRRGPPDFGNHRRAASR